LLSETPASSSTRRSKTAEEAVLRERKEHKVAQVHRGIRVPLVVAVGAHRGTKGTKGTKGRRDFRVLLARRVWLVHRALQALRVPPVLKALQAYKVPQARKEQQVHKELPDCKERSEPKVPLVIKEQQVHRELRGPKGLQALRAGLDYRVTKDFREAQERAHRALRGQLGCRDLRVLQDHKEPRALVRRDLPAHKELQEPKAFRGIRGIRAMSPSCSPLPPHRTIACFGRTLATPALRSYPLVVRKDKFFLKTRLPTTTRAGQL
jgi:hypothetical protein